MEWFRFYDEALNDPKVQRLPGELFKTWVNLLCLANTSSDRGYLPASYDDIAWALRMRTEDVKKDIHTLQGQGLLDWVEERNCYCPHNWHIRQKPSDNSTARVQKHREKVAVTDTFTDEKDETLQKRFSNALEQSRTEQSRTETETRNVTPVGGQDMPPQVEADIQLREYLYDQAANLMTKGTLTKAHRNSLGAWFTQHKAGLTREIIEYGVDQSATYTGGDCLDYLCKVMANKIAGGGRRNGKGGDDPARSEMPGKGYSWDVLPDGSWRPQQDSEGNYAYGYDNLMDVIREDNRRKEAYMARRKGAS